MKCYFLLLVLIARIGTVNALSTRDDHRADSIIRFGYYEMQSCSFLMPAGCALPYFPP
jgi:hypothetical protein